MAIYHFTVKNILRTQGKSATAAAAYRATEKIEDTYTGLIHDYTRKQWCVHKEILLPENAPPEYANRENLWCAAEWAEESPNGRVAREIEFSLPRELTREQQIDLARLFIQDNFVADGMIADWVIHDPPVRDSRGVPLDADGNLTSDPAKMIFYNPHVHCLLTVRPLDKKGKFEPKSQKEYVCKNPKTGEEKPLISSEFTALRSEGWEKEFRYTVNGQRVWLTPSEAEALGLQVSDRIFKNPRATMRGRENPKCAKWNSEETLKSWRQAWADAVNTEFERLGIDERIDHRSFIDQGREDEIPQVHLGPGVSHGWRHGEKSDRAVMNDGATKHNEATRERRTIEHEINRQIHEKATNIQSVRVDVTVNQAARAAVSMAALADDARQYRLNELDVAVREVDAAIALNNAALSAIETLLKALNNMTVLAGKGLKVTRMKLERERQDVKTREDYIRNTLSRFGCADAEELKRKAEELHRELGSAKKKLAEPAATPLKPWEERCREIIGSVPPDLREKLMEELEQLGMDNDTMKDIREAINELGSNEKDKVRETGRTR